MSLIQKTHVSGLGATAGDQALPPSLVLLLASGAGLSVASLYYSQPLLGLLGAQTGAGAQALGLVPMLTQLGYALGILLTAPLGDRHDRRTLIVLKCGLLVAALLCGALAPSIGWLMAASLGIGLAATVAQDIVPAAATLAPDARRGQAVGSVMTGLLLGILLSRVVSGLTAEHLGWRAVFLLAALLVAVLGVALWRGLPRFQPTTTLPYGALMASLLGLWQRHPAVRRAALSQAALGVGFSAVWSSLALWLSGAPFHLGSGAVGAFGIAGAAAALSAPLFGRLADRRGPHRVALLGSGIALVSFASMGLAPWLPRDAQLVLVVVAVVGFDLGFQGALISNQTLIYGAEPAARSRLNAVLFVAMFSGMSLGSALAGGLFAHFGWPGVVVLASTFAVLSIAIRVWPGERIPAGGTIRP
ncbi:MFS transporter [Hydrogenophaga sp.]|uniref:MFS transporter n=1 Tax=Hydrogenophaga sp. TaxID=1904254 RepID=UPI00262997D4|nr:MFS transporter [Hydrogenophaga sp.]MCW5654134.1 MFS transporter [Hydrogenophaga sp.]